MEINKKHLEVLSVMETPDNLILKYINGNWYLLFGGSFANESKLIEFYFHFKPYRLNILASTKKIDGCYLLDREVKSINIGNRILSLDDIDPLKNYLRQTVALSEDSIFNKTSSDSRATVFHILIQISKSIFSSDIGLRYDVFGSAVAITVITALNILNVQYPFIMADYIAIQYPSKNSVPV